MAFTQETIDFSQLSEKGIKAKLSELNIPLTTSEVLKIQKDMLKRPPSLAELILFSIQGSEHCSYKSSRNHLKNFTTEGPDVVLGAKEDAGVVSIATDNKPKSPIPFIASAGNLCSLSVSPAIGTSSLLAKSRHMSLIILCSSDNIAKFVYERKT